MNKTFNFIFNENFADVNVDVKLVLFDDNPLYHFSTFCVRQYENAIDVNMALSEFKVLCKDESKYCLNKDCLERFAFHAFELDGKTRKYVPYFFVETFQDRNEKLKAFKLPVTKNNNTILTYLNDIITSIIIPNETNVLFLYNSVEFKGLVNNYCEILQNVLNEISELHENVSFMSYLKTLCLTAAVDTDFTTVTKKALSEGKNPWVLAKYEQVFNTDFVSNAVNILYPFFDGEIIAMPAVYALGVNRVNTFEDFLYLEEKPTDEVLETVKTMFVENHDTFGSLKELLLIAELV